MRLAEHPCSRTDLPVTVVPHLATSAPIAVLEPSSEQECVEVVRMAGIEHIALVAQGGGTAIHTGTPLTAEQWALLGTTRLYATSHMPDDSLVTCQAGVCFSDMQTALAERGQFVALDPPLPDRATIGGVVASAGFGLWHCSTGGPKDAVVAVRAVASAGDAVASGARVVKNAAGYDLCRLLCGSWGSLGIVTEVTFRTHPLPAATFDVALPAQDTGSALAVAYALWRANLSLRYVVVAGSDPPRVLAGGSGNAKSCTWQQQRIAEIAGAPGEASSNRERDALRLGMVGQGVSAAVRALVLPSELPALLDQFSALTTRVLALVPSGIVYAACDGPEPDAARFVREVERALPRSTARTWLRLPNSAVGHVDPWGMPDALALMRAIKNTMDPGHIFSPGRCVGGL